MANFITVAPLANFVHLWSTYRRHFAICCNLAQYPTTVGKFEQIVQFKNLGHFRAIGLFTRHLLWLCHFVHFGKNARLIHAIILLLESKSFPKETHLTQEVVTRGRPPRWKKFSPLVGTLLEHPQKNWNSKKEIFVTLLNTAAHLHIFVFSATNYCLVAFGQPQ